MRYFRNIYLLIVAILVLAISGCRPDDEYFARPVSLEGTITVQLESLGNFTHYLEALYRTPYGPILEKSGLWTVFAPNDEAFEAYMQENGYTSVASMPWIKVSSIVEYSIITGAYNRKFLTYSSLNQWYEGYSHRKRTQYMDTIVEMDANDYPNYINWKNQKYLVDEAYSKVKTTVYWCPSYVLQKVPVLVGGYSNLEYIYDVPMTEEYVYIGGSKALQESVPAENGFIYEIGTVYEPLPNLYQNLTSDEYGGKYSMFKNMIDRFGEFRFWKEIKNPVTGAMDSIFRQEFLVNLSKNYLAFNLNDESYPPLMSGGERTESNSTGLTVPTNEALTDYLQNSILGQYYTSYDDMPLDVIGILANLNFYQLFGDILPTRIGDIYNLSLEKIDLQLEDITDKKFCSNGLFYGLNTVYTPKSFSTVIGPALLDTSFSIMYKSIRDLGLEGKLKSTGGSFSLIGVKNSQLINIPEPNSPTRIVSVVDYNYDLSEIYLKVTGDPTAGNNRIYPVPGTIPSQSDLEYVSTTLKNITLNQIIETPIELSNDNYYKTNSGDLVFISGGNKIQGGGNIYDGTSAGIVKIMDMINGEFYYMTAFIKMPTRYTYGSLTDNGPGFTKFQQVLTGADLRVSIIGSSTDYLIGLLDLNKTYTLFAPNDAAVQEAVTDGVIPNPDPAYLNTLTPLERATARVKLSDFAKKHFIVGSVPTDGKTRGLFTSLYVKAIIDLVPQYQGYTIVNNFASSSLDLKDPDNGQLLLSTGIRTNMLSKKVVIHEINTYLR